MANNIAKTSALTTEHLAAALAATPGVSDWQVTVLEDEEAQQYVIGERVEAQREVHNERARVTVYNRHPAHSEMETGDALGMAGVTLLESDAADERALSQKLAEAVELASLTDNQPYALPGPPADGFPNVQTADPDLARDMTPAVQRTMDQLRSLLQQEQQVELSSAELLVTRSSRAMRSGQGIAAIERGTVATLDFVVLARDASGTAEFHAQLERRRLRDFALGETVPVYASYARHLLRARPPQTHRGPVILSGEALASLFSPPLGPSPLAYHTSAEAAYRGASRLKPGDWATGEPPRGDRITLSSDAIRPWGLSTAAFDGDGLPARLVRVIDAGRVRQRWATARYAAYLGIPATGAFANIRVEPGTASLDELRVTGGGPIYEIVAFSFMQPDAVSGEFVAEIRLGYRHDARGTVPVKGGALAGNVFSALRDVRLSRETYSDGRYLGPRAMRFAELTIAGE